jgi:phosphomannomutase
LAEKFKKEYKRVTTLDGVKVIFDFGWILIRASNTSPKIRLYVEAKTEKKFKFLKDKFSKILEKWIKL